jgi:hypothetical protein
VEGSGVGSAVDSLSGIESTVPHNEEAVHVYDNPGEIVNVMRVVYGTNREQDWI